MHSRVNAQKIEKQLNEQKSREIGSGIGLGLYICKRIAILIDGECDVRSVPNDTTIFTFHVTANNMVHLDYLKSEVEPKDSKNNGMKIAQNLPDDLLQL
jgi:hypothetical protein